MTTKPTALFAIDGDEVVPTELSRGPWDPRACHGGPIGALLARAVEHTDGGDVEWQLSRITVELTRPVPLEPLHLSTALVRPGRKVNLVEAALTRVADGVEVARCRALRIRRDPIDLPDDPLSAPEEPFADLSTASGGATRFPTDLTAFHVDGAELRFSEGTFMDSGPAKVWIRLQVPVVDGEEPSGVQRVMAAADFGNGVSGALPHERFRYINPDLTVHLLRPPAGEWIGMDSRSHYGPLGAGLAESALYDAAGRIGRSVQSLLIDEWEGR